MSVTTGYLLNAVFALGSIALFLMLPRGRASKSLAGAMLGLAALASLLVLLATSVAGDASQTIYFYFFSAIAIASAARVITHRKPVYSALYFVLTIIAVAALMVLLQAEFLAIALIIIYAGAILVTYLFVIMLAQSPGTPVYDHTAREPLVTVFACFLFLTAVMTQLSQWNGEKSGQVGDGSATSTMRLAADASVSDSTSAGTKVSGETLAVGWTIMTKYIVALELAGVLLLVSMVGAIAMSRRRVVPETARMPERPLGQIGKEVPPY